MSMTGRYLRVSMKRIREIRRRPSILLNVLYPVRSEYPDGTYLDIDKTWQTIHYLLNEDLWEGEPPAFNAVLGGAILTDEDLGYGPARYLTPTEVRSTSDFLSGIPADALWSRRRRDPTVEAELYGSLEAEDEPYFRENYVLLQEFFRRAADGNDAIILWLA